MQGSHSSSFEKFSGKKHQQQTDDMPSKRVQGNKHRKARRNKEREFETYYS